MLNRRALVIACFVGCLLAGEIVVLMMTPNGGIALDGKLSETNEKAIDILIDLSKLFITYGYTILGATAILLKQDSSSPMRKSRLHFAEALIAATAGIGTIFWGHIVLTSITSMISHDFLDLQAPVLVWAVRLQYLCLVIALIFLVAYVTRDGIQR